VVLITIIVKKVRNATFLGGNTEASHWLPSKRWNLLREKKPMGIGVLTPNAVQRFLILYFKYQFAK
jgi:hypothetical protein